MSDDAPLGREDVLLLLAAGADGPYPLDPVRLMKGAFLVTERGRPEWRNVFHFEAYDYGPFDRRVYEARDALIRAGLFEATPGRFDTYQLTDTGRVRVQQLSTRMPDDVTWIERIGRYVSTRSFNKLLEEIYALYPQYRERSRFRS